MRDPSGTARTIRELGGEIWAELQRVPDDVLSWQAQNRVVDIAMGVLARYAGCVIENDRDLPVEPLSPVR